MGKLSDEAFLYLKGKNIELPKDEKEAVTLFLGAQIVDKINYWVDRSHDYIDNPTPSEPFARPNSPIAKEDAAYRDCFSKMAQTDKEQVKKLIQESVEGVLFSTFLLFDQPPTGNLEISISENGEKVIINKNKELHDDLYKWIGIFSEKLYKEK